MDSLPEGFKAVVLGASGAIGGAFVNALSNIPSCSAVSGLSRRSSPSFDIEDEASIARCAEYLKSAAPFHLIVDATGALSIGDQGPEKRIEDLSAERLLRAFMVNSIGPALLMKHFIPLFPLDSRCIFAKLSARVGSISDNRKGGWYGYRASKAALNMFLRTAAVEVCRKRPQAVFVALQPGTVRSRLSAPFLSGVDAMEPETAVRKLLAAIDQLPPSRQAVFIDHDGEPVPW